MTRIWALVFAALTWIVPALADDYRSFERGSWQEIRNAHAGRPVIVHFWGITCGPCRVEMPEWGRLLAEHPGLPLVTVHSDPMPPDVSVVTTMLKAAGLQRAENWVFDDGFKERLRYEIDPVWRGELPRTLMIAADGKATVLLGTADVSEVRAWMNAQGLGPELGQGKPKAVGQ
jgi:thiol-disulfide isomerase/thioredoxin